MDATQIASAEACVKAAQDGSLSFPEIIGRLINAGFESYLVDYQQGIQTFYLPSGAATSHRMALPACPVVARFDATEIEGLVRWAQTSPADYSYATFSDRVRAAGCAGYLVSFLGRRVVYYGRTAETHVEHFPS